MEEIIHDTSRTDMVGYELVDGTENNVGVSADDVLEECLSEMKAYCINNQLDMLNHVHTFRIFSQGVSVHINNTK